MRLSASGPCRFAVGRSALVRLALYRLHLYVLMIAEGPSRGIAVTDGRHDYVTRLLTEEIAHLAGFEHPEYLSVAFKREVGLRPQAFRRQHQARHPRAE